MQGQAAFDLLFWLYSVLCKLFLFQNALCISIWLWLFTSIHVYSEHNQIVYKDHMNSALINARTQVSSVAKFLPNQLRCSTLPLFVCNSLDFPLMFPSYILSTKPSYSLFINHQIPSLHTCSITNIVAYETILMELPIYERVQEVINQFSIIRRVEISMGKLLPSL